jgi:hypothetical protein
MPNERLLDKSHQPTDAEMCAAIGSTLSDGWTELRRFLVDTYAIEPLFNDGGRRYGWNLQYRKGGKPLCEMYPEYGSFTALVILGGKELSQAMAQLDSFGPHIRQALVDTPRLHDGCWMYIRMKDPSTVEQDVNDIKRLILLKKKPPIEKRSSSA